MHKTTGTGHVANEFADEVPGVSEGTVVDSDWLNTVQRELVALVEAAGLTLDGGDDAQILQALGRQTVTVGENITAGDVVGRLNGAYVKCEPKTLLTQTNIFTGGAAIVAYNGHSDYQVEDPTMVILTATDATDSWIIVSQWDGTSWTAAGSTGIGTASLDVRVKWIGGTNKFIVAYESGGTGYVRIGQWVSPSTINWLTAATSIGANATGNLERWLGTGRVGANSDRFLVVYDLVATGIIARLGEYDGAGGINWITAAKTLTSTAGDGMFSVGSEFVRYMSRNVAIAIHTDSSVPTGSALTINNIMWDGSSASLVTSPSVISFDYADRLTYNSPPVPSGFSNVGIMKVSDTVFAVMAKQSDAPRRKTLGWYRICMGPSVIANPIGTTDNEQRTMVIESIKPFHVLRRDPSASANAAIHAADGRGTIVFWQSDPSYISFMFGRQNWDGFASWRHPDGDFVVGGTFSSIKKIGGPDEDCFGIFFQDPATAADLEVIVVGMPRLIGVAIETVASGNPCEIALGGVVEVGGVEEGQDYYFDFQQGELTKGGGHQYAGRGIGTNRLKLIG